MFKTLTSSPSSSNRQTYLFIKTITIKKFIWKMKVQTHYFQEIWWTISSSFFFSSLSIMQNIFWAVLTALFPGYCSNLTFFFAGFYKQNVKFCMQHTIPEPGHYCSMSVPSQTIHGNWMEKQTHKDFYALLLTLECKRSPWGPVGVILHKC